MKSGNYRQDDPSLNRDAEIEKLLDLVSHGDPAARRELFAILYRELHALAHEAMKRERPGHMLQTTALVHETFVSLVRNGDVRWRNRAHFYGVAARAMRSILVDEARRRQAVKRGGSKESLSLDDMEEPGDGINVADESLENLVLLDVALEKLNRSFNRKCTIVELRYFVGLTLQETAEVLGISRATVNRDWEFTRDWLRREMQEIADFE